MKIKKYLFTFYAFILLVLLFIPIYTPLHVSDAFILSNLADADLTVFKTPSELPNSAKSAILIDADSGRIIYSKNENQRLPMASTTKIMTALLALELADPKTVITIPKEAVNIEGSSIYLREGEVFTCDELLYGLMLESGNDAAVALAIALGGSVERFADLMNTKAHELGLENTHFVNPHGLPAENHYTTALELAKITQIAMKNQTFKTIVSTQKTTVCGRLFVNHNKLLFDFDGICGVKTGFTKSAGRCLVTAAQRNGVSLIAVTLNGPSCSQDHKNLLNFGFSYLSSVCLSQKGSIDYQIAVTGGNKLFCHVTNSKSIDISVPQGTTTTTVVSRSKIIYAPIKKGDILGEIKYYSKNKLVASTPLAATEDITIKKINLFNKLFD